MNGICLFLRRLFWRPPVTESIDRLSLSADTLKRELEARPGTLREAVRLFAERL